MRKLLDKVRDKLGRGSLSEGSSLPDKFMLDLQRELSQITASELKRDLQTALASAGNDRDRNALTTAFKAQTLILDQGVPKIDRETMEALVAASSHPDFNAARLILGDPVNHINENRMRHVLNVSLFFGLFRESGVRSNVIPTGLHQLSRMTDSSNFAELRKEPEDYLRALIRMFMEMPMELIIDGCMHPDLLILIKDDPAAVSDIMTFTIQRNIKISDVDPALCKEAISAPSVVLREGAL